jgi:hypothetical protein
MSSKGLALLVIDSVNGNFLNLPNKHDSQTVVVVAAMLDKLHLFNILFTTSAEGWPSL